MPSAPKGFRISTEQQRLGAGRRRQGGGPLPPPALLLLLRLPAPAGQRPDREPELYRVL